MTILCFSIWRVCEWHHMKMTKKSYKSVEIDFDFPFYSSCPTGNVQVIDFTLCKVISSHLRINLKTRHVLYWLFIFFWGKKLCEDSSTRSSRELRTKVLIELKMDRKREREKHVLRTDKSIDSGQREGQRLRGWAVKPWPY